MTVYDELVDESKPTLTSMPDGKRTDEPWRWVIRLNFNDPETGELIDLTKAKAVCRVTSVDGDELCTFKSVAGKGEVVIDATDKQKKLLGDRDHVLWSLELTLPDKRVVQIFDKSDLRVLREFEPIH